MARWANLNQYPVSLPTARGGTRMFRTGEFTSESWFSRFAGDGQLKKVPDDWTPVRMLHGPRQPIKVPNFGRAPVQVKRPSRGGPCVSSCQSACQATCEMVCEQTKQQVVIREHHEQVGKTLYCRYCDWSTMEQSKVTNHLKAYHPKRLTGPGAKRGSASADSSGGPRASGAPASRPPKGKSAVPRQAPVSAGSSKDGNQWWYRKDGLLQCKTCEAAGHGWQSAHLDGMQRHCQKYHGMLDEKEKKKPAPPAVEEPEVSLPGDTKEVVEDTPPTLFGKSSAEVQKLLEEAQRKDEEQAALARANGIDPERPWKCEFCARSFTTKSGLGTHQRWCKAKKAAEEG